MITVVQLVTGEQIIGWVELDGHKDCIYIKDATLFSEQYSYIEEELDFAFEKWLTSSMSQNFHVRLTSIITMYEPNDQLHKEYCGWIEKNVD